MERRKEPRFESSQPVRVTILGDRGGQLAGRILNVSGTGMRLEVSVPVAAGTLLQIEWDRTLVLAEVCYCQQAAAGFVLGVMLEHCLLDTDELARLARALAGENDARDNAKVLTPHS